MSKIHYAVEISTDAGDASHTPLAVTNAAIGLVNGVFRFVSDRPKYDGSNGKYSYGAGEIDNAGAARTDLNNVFYEGFFQKQGILSSPSNEIDIAKGGDAATITGFEFVITNSSSFWNSMKTAGPGGTPIQLSGRKVRFIIFIDDVFYSWGVFSIENNPYDEIDYHYSCGPNLNVHKMIPPNVITTVTFPAIGIGSQQTSKVTINGAVAPESNIPANATVQSDILPVCFGDIAYAELFNVEGVPLFENISILGRGLIIPPGMSNLFNISCAVASDDSSNAAKGNIFTGVFNPGMAFWDDHGNPTFTICDYGYALVLVQEDLQSAPYCWAGYGPVPYSMASSLLVAGSSLNPGNVDLYKDCFVFKRGDQKGIRILRSCTSYSQYLVSLSPNKYRYLFVTVLVLAEGPEDFDITKNTILAPGLGFTPTDYVPMWSANVGVAQGTVDANNTTFWTVCKNIIKQVVSNYPIYKFTPALINGITPAYTINAQGLPVLRSFSSNYKIYENVNNLIQSAVVSPASTDDVGFPYLQLKANADVQQNGVSLLNPIIIPASAIKKIEYTVIDPYLDEDETGNRVPRSILYGTIPSGTIPPYIADSTKPIGSQVTYNAADFNNLVDRDRTTFFPYIYLSQQNATPTRPQRPTGGVGSPDGALAVKITGTDSNGGVYQIQIDTDPHTGYPSGYPLPTGYAPFDILWLTGGGGTYASAMIQILTVSSSGVPLTIKIYRAGTGYSVGYQKAYIVNMFNGSQNQSNACGYIVTFSIDISSLIDTDIEKAFFGIDFIASSTYVTPQPALSFGLGFRMKDQYDRDIYLGDIVANGTIECGVQGFLDPTGNWIVRSVTEQNTAPPNNYPIYNLLPKDYYVGGGNDAGESDRFFLSSYPPAIGSGNAFSEIDLKTVMELVKNRIAQPTLLVDFAILGNANRTIGKGAQLSITRVASNGAIGDQSLPSKGTGYYINDVLLIDGGVGGNLRVDTILGGGGGPGPINHYTITNTGTAYSTGLMNMAVLPANSLNPQYADIFLKIKQIGFVSQKVVNTGNKQLFTEVKGETVGNDNSTFTNTVHTAFKHILEDYDKIPTTLIDYGNLSTTRGLAASDPWYIGRQLTDRKNSIDYIKELCQQSYVGYFISRLGKHTFSAWRQNTTPVATHTQNDPILRDSITNFGKTDISEVFNDMNISYNWNPGLGKFDKSIIITHVDNQDPGATVTTRTGMSNAHSPSTTPPFPDGLTYVGGDTSPGCVDIDGIPLWEKYCSFPGIPKTPIASSAQPTLPNIGDSYYATATAGDWTATHYYVWGGSSWVDGGTAGSPIANGYPACYNAALALWTVCHNSWLGTFTIQQTNGELSELSWFIDRSILSDLTAAAQGVGNKATAFLFLNESISWITVQKNMCSYSIPINSTTVFLDLLNPINFSDYFYTANVTKLGWITKISPDVLNGKFNITLTLQDGTV